MGAFGGARLPNVAIMLTKALPCLVRISSYANTLAEPPVCRVNEVTSARPMARHAYRSSAAFRIRQYRRLRQCGDALRELTAGRRDREFSPFD